VGEVQRQPAFVVVHVAAHAAGAFEADPPGGVGAGPFVVAPVSGATTGGVDGVDEGRAVEVSPFAADPSDGSDLADFDVRMGGSNVSAPHAMCVRLVTTRHTLNGREQRRRMLR